jgi:hypothetical protein
MLTMLQIDLPEKLTATQVRGIDQDAREKNLQERHAFLVATHRRLQDYETQLAAWEADLKQREAVLGKAA